MTTTPAPKALLLLLGIGLLSACTDKGNSGDDTSGVPNSESDADADADADSDTDADSDADADADSDADADADSDADTDADPDTTDPTVALIGIEEGQVIGSPTVVGVEASDDIGLASITLLLDGDVLWTGTVAEEYTLDPLALSTSGPHTFTAIAADAADNTAQDERTVIVDRQAPLPDLTSPNDGDLLLGTVTVAGTISDDTDIVSGELFIDGVSVATLTGAGEITYDWDTTTAAFGAHAISLTATDGAGATMTDSLVVNVDNPPTGAFINPLDGDSVLEDVSIEVTASDDENVSAVEVTIGGDSLGYAYAAPYTFDWNTCNNDEGPQDLILNIWDDAEQLTTVTIHVTTANVDADGDTWLEVCDLDCDDADPSTYPGATDTWYDSIDSNCDGASDFDRDADGYDSETYGGTDCDDGDRLVNPGQTDTPANGIDEDCSGSDAPQTVSALVSGDLLVTEIMFDPLTGDDNYCEWVELYNNTPYPVDLQGLVITDDDASGNGSIGVSTVIESGTFAVLAKSSEANFATNCPELYAVMPIDAWYGTQPGLSNSGDPVFLKNAAGTIIDDTATCSSLWDSCQLSEAVVGAATTPGTVLETGNDALAAWCASIGTIATDTVDSTKIDKGTPGASSGTACP